MKHILIIYIVFMAVFLYSADITWRKYKEIPSDITIGQGDVLTIEAGTILRFGRNARLTVKGEIKALGTAEAGIRFLPLNRFDPFWNGVKLDSASGYNEFSYCRFDFIDMTGNGDGSFTNEASEVIFSNCVFKANSADAGGALNIIGGNTEIYDSDFTDNTAADGGAVNVTATPVDSAASRVIINGCRFYGNKSTGQGGAIYLGEPVFTEQVMNININDCVLYENTAFEGGAVFYSNSGGTSLTMKRNKLYSNSASTGSAVFMNFCETSPGNIPPQVFANLLIFKNSAEDISALAIDMGMTQNPGMIDFTNVTIGFNYSPNETCAGISVRSDGNYPQIRNSIIWGNQAGTLKGNFFIQDGSLPAAGDVFKFCDIENYLGTDTNISQFPLFVRRPQNAIPEIFDEERYDFHISLLSPCVNSGDPLEPSSEPDNSRVNIGAYGNTVEATKGSYNTILASAVSNLNIGDGQITVMDFQGKSGKFILDNIDLGRNSQLYLKSSDNASISVNSLTSALPIAGKFTDEYSKIQKLVIDSASTDIVQSITVSRIVQLYNTDMSDVTLKIKKDGILSPQVNMNDTKIFTTLATADTGVVITDATIVNIQNSKFLDYGCGISVQNTVKNSKLNTYGSITGNYIGFKDSVQVKAGTQKMIGIEINNSNIDIEDNDIDGADEGIVMKAGSSGRISNNSVSFEPTASNKGGFPKKAIIVSDNSSSAEITGNNIFSTDSITAQTVTGIEIDNSSGNVFYNILKFSGESSGDRTGIDLISPQTGTAVYNNTIFGTYTGIGNSPSAEKIDITNNIFWSWDSTSVQAVNDTTNLRFFNNCFIKGLPAGITGENNINIDPEFNSDYTGDFTLASTSPCINAGKVIDGVHSFASSKTVYYYGSAPDIGAEEFWQDSQPVNVSTTVIGTDFTFGWDAVDGFTYYKVYESDDPFGTFTLAYHGTSLSFTASVSTKKFYYVVATTDAPTKIYESNKAVSQIKSDAPPTIRENAKPFRIRKQQQDNCKRN